MFLAGKSARLAAAKFERHKSERARLERDLWDFRQKLKRTGDRIKRLEMFREMAALKYKTRDGGRYARQRIRNDFHSIKKTRCRIFGKLCEICQRALAAARHHIVQLQNGGPNHRINMVGLCDDCHAEIHPWLKEFAPPEIV